MIHGGPVLRGQRADALGRCYRRLSSLPRKLKVTRDKLRPDHDLEDAAQDNVDRNLARKTPGSHQAGSARTMSIWRTRTSVVHIRSVPSFDPALRCTELYIPIRSGMLGVISPTALFLTLGQARQTTDTNCRHVSIDRRAGLRVFSDLAMDCALPLSCRDSLY
jgi:hypothetical protein